MLKVCLNCKEEKSIKENFDICYTKTDGKIIYRNKCKKCRWEMKKSNKSNQKKCKTCKKTYDISNYYVYQKRLNDITYRSDCKKCFDDKKLKKPKIEEKKCTQCNIVKKIKDFNVNIRNNDKTVIYRSECKKCQYKATQERRDKKNER